MMKLKLEHKRPIGICRQRREIGGRIGILKIRVDHVFPPLPVRRWVLSVPKRLRWYLERQPNAVSAVLHILLRVIEAHLRQSSPGA